MRFFVLSFCFFVWLIACNSKKEDKKVVVDYTNDFKVIDSLKNVDYNLADSCIQILKKKCKDSFFDFANACILEISSNLKQNKNKEAIELSKKFDLVVENKKLTQFYGVGNHHLGLAYLQLDKSDSAIYYLQKALPELIIAKNNTTYIKSLSEIGFSYSRISNYKTALKYIYDALAFAENNNLADEIPSIQENLGMIYFENNQVDSTIFYFNKCEKDFIIQNDLRSLANLKLNMGSVYFQKEDYNTAIKYYTDAILHLKEQQLEYVVPTAQYNLAKTYNALKQFLKSNSILNQIKLEKGTEQELQTRITRLYASNFKSLNDYKNASIKYVETLKADSVYNEEKQKVVSAELEIKYETEKKEKEFLKLQNAQIVKNKMLWLWIFIATILAIVVLAVFYIYRQREKIQKLNNYLYTKATVKETKLLERMQISRDLHDHLGAYTTAIIQNTDELKKDNSNPKTLDSLNNNAKELMQQLRENIALLQDKQTDILDFLDSFKGYIQRILVSYEHIQFNGYENITLQRELTSLENVNLMAILKEFLNNSIKHSKCNAIALNVFEENNKINIVLKDNGIGYNLNEEFEGNGLKNIKNRASTIDVNFEIYSKEGTGTEIRIIL